METIMTHDGVNWYERDNKGKISRVFFLWVHKICEKANVDPKKLEKHLWHLVIPR